jgi:hypothetical protein
MSNGDGPWTKFQSAPTEEKGPWSQYAQPKAEPPKESVVEAPKAQWTPPSEQLPMRGKFGTVPGLHSDVPAQGTLPEYLKAIQAPASIMGSTIGAASVGVGSGVMSMIMRALGSGAGGGIGTLATTGSVKEALKAAGEFAVAEGAGEATVEGVGKVVGKLAPKVEPLAKINKLLGVGPAQVVPGKTPASLNEFAANPARGALKAGLSEEKLAKWGPLERNAAIMKAKDAAGEALDQQLEIATQQGKKVDISSTIDKAFSGVEDKEAAKKVEDALNKILLDNKIYLGSESAGIHLEKLTPVQAKTIQEALSDLPEGTIPKNTKDVLVQGVRQAIKKGVPELAPLNQNYWDLAQASKGTQKLARKYATTVPENKLRKMVIKGLASGLAGGAGATIGYELFKGKGATLVP